jgi:hypothetical protein
VVKVANKEPLWYGKGGENTFSYEQSEWHQHLADTQRSSDDQRASSSNGSPTGMEEKQEV